MSLGMYQKQQSLGSKKVLKSLSQSRWSAQADAVSALHEGWKQIIEPLMSIAKDLEQPRETRHEALTLSIRMGTCKLFY